MQVNICLQLCLKEPFAFIQLSTDIVQVANILDWYISCATFLLPGPSSSRKRHRPHTLKDAIEEAGLTEKAVVDDQVYLSRLSRKERVSLLASIGQDIAGDDIFSSLSRTALELHGANIKDMDKISAPRGILLPVVGTNELFIREE